ncbi:GTP binding domain protein [Rutstroemia sp. NJR-2017a WRK4]|nr:GTP binding domain protein [Rutstroemia sp. NJR-2017a WRK4]
MNVLFPAPVTPMGITGTGKSTFISKLLQEESDIVGHNLSSRTSGIDLFPLEYEDGRRIFLLDTPGFDDTFRSDADILKEIAFVLAQTYRKKIHVAGIVYMHRITDNRVSGTSLRNITLLKSLCGEKVFPKVFLVSSMWDLVAGEPELQEEATARELELRSTNEFWGSLCNGGSQVARWTGDEHSTLGIIDHIMTAYKSTGYEALRIQKELVDQGKCLKETEAGKAVSQALEDANSRHRGDILSISVSRQTALQHGDRLLVQEMENELDKVRKELRYIQRSQVKMKINMDSLVQEKTSEYDRLLGEVRREQRNISTAVQQYCTEQQRMLREKEDNERVLAEGGLLSESDRRERRDNVAIVSMDEAARFAIERANLDEVDEELQEQFEEEQRLLEERRKELEKRLRRARRKELMKKNTIPILSLLAGLGVTIGGGVLINPAMIAAGAGIMVSGAQKLDFNRKKKKKDNEEEETKPVFDEID